MNLFYIINAGFVKYLIYIDINTKVFTFEYLKRRIGNDLYNNCEYIRNLYKDIKLLKQDGGVG